MTSAVRGGVSLKHRTSLSVGGTAERVYFPVDVEELRRTIVELRGVGMEPFLLGAGCNTIFPDHTFDRAVIVTEKLRRIRRDSCRVRAEAGVRLETLIRAAIRWGLGGLEMFKGIPGSVGGAVAMNAGGSGFEFGDRVASLLAVESSSGEVLSIPGSAIDWRYRAANLDGLVVAEVELELVPEDPDALNSRAREFMKRKAATQPLSTFNAGCIFKNPPGGHAAQLLERAGLKGERVGDAVISDRHANFIINHGGRATASDVLELIERARARVRERFGVALELEVVVARAREP